MRSSVVLACTVALCVQLSPAPTSSRPGPAPHPAAAAGQLSRHAFATAPSPAQCRGQLGVACYTPQQIQRAYGVTPLHAAGVTGAGRTIAVVVPFGSPTIESDLRAFDRQFGLADPPSVRTIAPAGAIPAFDPADQDRVNWAFEASLDVQYAHVLAPGADILVVATPVSETEGVQGFPEIMAAERFVIEYGLADVISQSFAAAEDTFPPGAVDRLRQVYVEAQRARVTVLGAAGDTGATAYGSDDSTLSADPVVSWPASDPLVTAVGGTALHLDVSGTREAGDQVWNGTYGSGGGGRSALFDRPAFQDGESAVVGAQRGVPDVAMSAAVDGGVLVYTSFGGDAGWNVVGGTSLATPLFAGIVALACDWAGHSLGDINPALYAMADAPSSGLVDVTGGDNSFGGVPGYPAGPGYDLASGLGTVDAPVFVPALAAAAAG